MPILERSLAAARGESDAFDLFFLAMARHRLGQTVQARADFDRALRWRQEHPRQPPQWANELDAFQAEAEAVLAGPPGELPADVFAPSASDLVAVLRTLPDGRSVAAPRRPDRPPLGRRRRDVQPCVVPAAGRPSAVDGAGPSPGLCGRWSDAADAYGRVVTARPIDDDWVEYGFALVLAGDVAGYRRLCTRLAARLDAIARPSAFELALAARVARLSPDSGIDPERLLRWADDAAAADPGRPGSSTREGPPSPWPDAPNSPPPVLHQAIAKNPTWPGRVMASYAQVIACARLGRVEEARGYLDRAEHLLQDAERSAETSRCDSRRTSTSAITSRLRSYAGRPGPCWNRRTDPEATVRQRAMTARVTAAGQGVRIPGESSPTSFAQGPGLLAAVVVVPQECLQLGVPDHPDAGSRHGRRAEPHVHDRHGCHPATNTNNVRMCEGVGACSSGGT